MANIITEKGLRMHNGHCAELCTIAENPKDSGNFEDHISYRPGTGFYVGNRPVGNGDVLILKPYMEPDWRRDKDPGVSFFRVTFFNEGLLPQEGS